MERAEALLPGQHQSREDESSCFCKIKIILLPVFIVLSIHFGTSSQLTCMRLVAVICGYITVPTFKLKFAYHKSNAYSYSSWPKMSSSSSQTTGCARTDGSMMDQIKDPEIKRSNKFLNLSDAERSDTQLSSLVSQPLFD